MTKPVSIAASALLIGTPKLSPGSAEIDSVLKESIEKSIDHLTDWMADGGDAIDYPALSGRRLLEAATMALLARIDPLRALYVWRAQSLGHYSLERRNKIAVQWAGDIFPSGGNERLDADIDAKVDPYRVDRCLFGKAQNAIVWTPAFEALNDEWVKQQNQNKWQVDALKIPAENFMQTCVRPISDAYSALSKCIHLESLVQQATILPDDVNAYVANSVKSLALFAAALEVSISDKSRWRVQNIHDQHCLLEAVFGQFSS